MIMIRSLSWWYWAVTAVLLAFGVAGHDIAFGIVILLSAWQCVHFFFMEKSAKAFPVQVRIAFLLIMCAAFLEPLRWFYWIPLAGTTAMVLTGYCPLARTLSLMPWNRKEPLSLSLLKRTYLSPPVRGSILQGLPPR